MKNRARLLLLVPAIVGLVALTGCSTSNIPKGASLGNFSDTPGSIVVTILPNSLAAGSGSGGSGSSSAAGGGLIIVHVKDRFGNPITDGTQVVITLSNGVPTTPGTAFSATVQSPVTTLKGVATSTLTPGPQAGSGTITAVVDDMQGTANFTINTSTASAPPPGASTATLTTVTLTAAQTALPADGSSSTLITATLVDSAGSSTTQAGKSVNFSTDSGSIEVTGGTPTNSINGLVTNVNGQVSVTFIAPKTPGLATISASSQGKVGSVTINNFGTPFTIQIDPDITPNPQPAQVFVNGSGQPTNSTIFFKVVDRNGSPVLQSSTRTVEYIILNGGLGGGESVSPGLGTGSTISNGIAKTVFRAGARAGTVKLIAFIEAPIIEGITLATTAGSGTVTSAGFTAAIGAQVAANLAAGTPFKLKVLSGADQGTYTVLSMGAGTATVTPAFSASATAISFRVDHGRLLPSDIQTNAIEIGIAGDLPSGENLSLVTQLLNIAGLNIYGLTDTITSFLADRFNNPVPIGTSVNFTVFDQANLLSVAAVTGTGITAAPASGVLASTVSGVLRSQAPDPVTGFVRLQAQTDGAGSAHVRSLLFVPVFDNTNNVTRNTLYAGTDGGGIFRTPNPNQDPTNTVSPSVKWIQAGVGTTGLFNGVANVIVADPHDPSLIWAGTNDGVFRSHSSGEVWEDSSGHGSVTGDTVSVTWRAEAFPTNTPDAQPATEGGPPPVVLDTNNITVTSVLLRLNYSSSRSRSKTLVHIGNNAPTDQYVYDDFDPHVIHLFNCDPNGFGDEGNGGFGVLQNLFNVPPPPPGTALTLNTSITVDYQISDSLQGRTPVRGLAVNPLSVVNPRIIQGTLIDTRILYAGLDGGGVYRSTDGGFSWTGENSGLSNNRVLTLKYDPRNNELYAGTLGGGVFRTKATAFRDGVQGGDDLEPKFDANGIPLHTPLQWQDVNGDSTKGTSLLFREVHSIQIADAIDSNPGGIVGDAFAAGAELVKSAGDFRTPQPGSNFAASRTIVVGTKLGGVWLALDTGWPTPTWRAAATNISDVSSIVNTVVTTLVIDNPTTNTTANLFAAAIDDDDPQTNLGGVYRASLNTSVEFPGALILPTAGPTVTFNTSATAVAFSDQTATLTNRVVRALAYDQGDQLLYAGTNGRNVFRKDVSTAVAVNTDNWTLINDPNGQMPSALDQNLPTAITNFVYSTHPVLFSGPTATPDIVQIADSVHNFGNFQLLGAIADVPFKGEETFDVVISDINGNPLVGNSSVTIQSSAGTLGGGSSFTIPDTQANGLSATEFQFSLTNSNAGSAVAAAQINVTVNSPVTLQGAGGNGSITVIGPTRNLIPPTVLTGALSGGGAGEVTASLGSDTGVYIISLVSSSAGGTVCQDSPNTAQISGVPAAPAGSTITIQAINVNRGTIIPNQCGGGFVVPPFDPLDPASYGIPDAPAAKLTLTHP